METYNYPEFNVTLNLYYDKDLELLVDQDTQITGLKASSVLANVLRARHKIPVHPFLSNNWIRRRYTLVRTD